MNKVRDNIGNEHRPRRLNEKIKDILLLGCFALALVFASWKIFNTNDADTTFFSNAMSANEEKISRLLSEMDGVGEAQVMICEENDEVQSVVVVCEGAGNFQVVIRIREAVAAALGTEEKAVKVYLKKE